MFKWTILRNNSCFMKLNPVSSILNWNDNFAVIFKRQLTSDASPFLFCQRGWRFCHDCITRINVFTLIWIMKCYGFFDAFFMIKRKWLEWMVLKLFTVFIVVERQFPPSWPRWSYRSSIYRVHCLNLSPPPLKNEVVRKVENDALNAFWL